MPAPTMPIRMAVLLDEREHRSLRSMEYTQPMKKPLAPFVSYLLCFYLVWTVAWVYGVYPWATRTLGSATLAYAVVSIICRLLIWIVPVFTYLRYVDRVDAWDYLQLRHNWRRGVTIGLVLSLLNFLGMMARMGYPDWSHANITWNSMIGTSILVGVFEEIPFRGFILQKLQERFSFSTSVALSSLLFVGAHVPGWIMLGMLTASRAVYIFAFGVIMSIVLRYARSLWAPIVAHSLNDGLSNVIFHM
jgi:membrane protease YdiL (CAAX protease family)